MATSNDFPVAQNIYPVYVINDRWYRKVSADHGLNNPSAIRARIVAADGTSQIKWFEPIELPAWHAAAPSGEEQQRSSEEAA